jgi:hypothetical protein
MQLVAQIVVERFLLGQLVQKRGLTRVEVFVESFFEGLDITDRQIIQIALRTGKENERLALPRQRLKLRLFE